MSPDKLRECLEVAFRNYGTFNPDRGAYFKDWFPRYRDVNDELFEAAFMDCLSWHDKFPTFAQMNYAIKNRKRDVHVPNLARGYHSAEFYKALGRSRLGLSEKLKNNEITFEKMNEIADKRLLEICRQEGLMTEYEASKKVLKEEQCTVYYPDGVGYAG